MVAHICDPKVQETEVEGLQVPSQSGLCSQICIREKHLVLVSRGRGSADLLSACSAQTKPWVDLQHQENWLELGVVLHPCNHST